MHEPITFLTADFKSVTYIASFFILAILITCSIAIFPFISLLGTPDPFSSFNSFLINSETGGVPTEMSTSLVSVSIITFIGTFTPKKLSVFSLIFLITSEIFILKGPNFWANWGVVVAFPPSTIKSNFSLGILHF